MTTMTIKKYMEIHPESKRSGAVLVSDWVADVNKSGVKVKDLGFSKENDGHLIEVIE